MDKIILLYYPFFIIIFVWSIVAIDQPKCVDDAIVVDRLLKNYNKNKLPGDSQVDVSVEV
jgi:hypothetical protein